MTEQSAGAFETHDRFVTTESGVFELLGVNFDAWVRVGGDEIVVVSELPTLDSTVVGERVAPVVEEGWFETFQRRVEDVPGVVEAAVGPPNVERSGDLIRVETRIDAAEGDPDATIAAATYVEGTWVEGIIPGYEYDDRVQAIRNRARENAGDPP